MSRLSGFNITDLKNRIAGAFGGTAHAAEPDPHLSQTPAALQTARNYLAGEVPDRRYFTGKVPELHPEKFLKGEQTVPFTYGGKSRLTIEGGLPDMEWREEELFDKHRWGEDVGVRGREQPGGGLAGEHYRSLAGFMPDKPERMAGFTPPRKLNLDDIIAMYQAGRSGSGGRSGGAAGRPVIPYKHHIDVAGKLMGAMPQFQQAEALPLRWDLPVQPPTAGEPPAKPERDREKYYKLLGI